MVSVSVVLENLRGTELHRGESDRFNQTEAGVWRRYSEKITLNSVNPQDFYNYPLLFY